MAKARINIRKWAKFVMAEGLYETLRKGGYHEDLDQGLLRIHGGLSKSGHDVLDICNKHLNWAARTYTIENPDHVIDHVMQHLDDYQQESSFAEVAVALDCLDPTKVSAEAIAAALCWTGRVHPEYAAARRRFVSRVLDAGFEELVRTLGGGVDEEEMG